MVENVENAPDVGNDRNDSALTAQDVARADFRDFNRTQKEAEGSNSESLAAFDGVNGFELTNLTDTPVEKSSGDLVSLESRGASAQLREDGSLESLEIREYGSSIQFEFNENGIRRIDTDGDTKTVTEFNVDGSPLYASRYTPDSLHGESVPVSENDKVQIVDTGENLFVLSNDAKGDTTIRISDDGVVKGKTTKIENGLIETEYNEDGTLNFDSLTNYNENGDVIHKFTEHDVGTTEEFYDDQGKWEKTVVAGEGFIKTLSKLEDGSDVEVVENHDGTATYAVKKPDGTRLIGKSEPGKNTLTTLNTDGTKIITTETDDYSTNTYKTEDGYWVQYRTKRDTGVMTITRGDSKGRYEGTIVRYDI